MILYILKYILKLDFWYYGICNNLEEYFYNESILMNVFILIMNLGLWGNWDLMFLFYIIN